MAEANILHVDMDAFFVSVELLDQPELRGRPVVVGGAGTRGVVAAASYEARAYGVYSAMPSVRAKRLCPQAVFLPGHFHRYSEVSARVMARFETFTPFVEPLSLDEAFLDVTSTRRLLGDPPVIAAKIREAIHAEEGITCSVGVAPTKFVAKLASQAAKPTASPTGPIFGDGVCVVPDDELLAFLHPLPARALWGVGPATLTKLGRLGVRTVGDLAVVPIDALVASLGPAAGHHLHQLANGIDDREVEVGRVVKSIGHEETFSKDRRDHRSLEVDIVRFADAVASKVRANGQRARTITLKVRFSDFHTITRAVTIDAGTSSGTEMARTAIDVLHGIDPSQGVRLLGLSASGFIEADAMQLRFDDLGRPSWTDADRAVDGIRERFGPAAIGRAAMIGRDGVRVARRGDQQWGPDS